ncbi:hypothetical protein [Novosphingobium capsulatum]|uniref:hypothetical protein n=1 Tax=Novosphingobium capsulatum TaxID=13688 RepID=UPI000786A460|nr:hypothetical protein [Novosphingobium capsulatum]WQD92762.1 hypothetical protein U0041_17535 [Novosphingobium capsulatum]
MTVRVPQVNFSRGELGPQLYGRFDVEAYGSTLRQARNVLVLKYGGITKRPGTRLVGEVLDASKSTRLVPFQFSLTQTYALEMGQGYMAPCADGGRVLEEELAITGISNAAQAVVTVAYHGLAVGDWWYFDGVKDGLGDLLNGRAFKVVAILDDSHFAVAVDTSAAPSFTGCDGGITRSAPPTVPVAPVVPPVVPPPDPPATGGGGGGSFKGTQRF